MTFNMHLIGLQLRATKREWKSAPKSGIMFVQKPELVHGASKRQYTATGREVQVSWGGIHEWRKAVQGDWCTD